VKSSKSLLLILGIAFSSISSMAEGQETGIFIDTRDSTEYSWVRIGTQVWMAENLSYVPDSGSWCYKDEERNCEFFGRLYNWETAKEVCPDGWYLPSDEDWLELEEHLGIPKRKRLEMGYRGNKKGGALKASGREYWLHPNSGATNETGFDALPGGLRSDRNTYHLKGHGAYFWTSTQFLETMDGAWSRSLHYNNSFINRFGNITTHAFSVRCIRDDR
jgi:uncharacterized protein (TIGR02145 family)